MVVNCKIFNEVIVKKDNYIIKSEFNIFIGRILGFLLCFFKIIIGQKIINSCEVNNNNFINDEISHPVTIQDPYKSICKKILSTEGLVKRISYLINSLSKKLLIVFRSKTLVIVLVIGKMIRRL